MLYVAQEEGGVIERQYINALPKSLQSQLRKKNYVYQRPVPSLAPSEPVATSPPSASTEFNSTPYAEKPVKLVGINDLAWPNLV